MLSRWLLVETATLVPADVRNALLRIANGTPVPKPADHKGGEDTDMFAVSLPADTIRSIADTVDKAATNGLRTPRSTRLGGFATAWRELSDAEAKSRV